MIIDLPTVHEQLSKLAYVLGEALNMPVLLSQ